MICRKCKSKSTVTIRKEYHFCDYCFLSYIDHKFRACLGKSRKLRANENVLICLSGGISSAVLLDLVYHGICLNSHKKLRITPFLLHVTEQLPHDEINKRSILEQCNKCNFKLNVIDISHYFSKNTLLSDSHVTVLPEEIKQWKVSKTTSCDLLAHMKQNLYIQIAKELQCKIIFTAETTTTLAVNLLSDIAIGRGSQIENNIGFCDMKNKDAQILRPMRDITIEEVETYAAIKGIYFTQSKCASNKNSLQSIIQDFVSGLQENFPATLTTICKTADKISSSDSKDKICMFCKSTFDQDVEKLTAADATHFSSYVSCTKFDVCNPTLSGHLELVTSNQDLCYCCQRNVLELSTLSDLKNLVIES
ncbi:cytoplasmic tRNA 2-thiolation protein 2 [Aricia agestis]|uniref:cytoplasmic tRNA 2-thiolation protein 2 n=1 Tax=Aricia agestis TaxID=91739 RepID=UPI001C208261|nr:cytoplasmic tRNA 2-thiolation protein 2 [Aricia agestis]